MFPVVSILKAVGLVFRDIFRNAGKVEPVAGEVMVGTEPLAKLFLGLAVPWAVPRYDQAVQLIKNTEIASAVQTNGASGTGLQKASVVATAFEPLVLEMLKGKGVVSPTRAQIERYVEGAVMTLDAFEAMMTSPTLPQQAVPRNERLGLSSSSHSSTRSRCFSKALLSPPKASECI
jgi:hypothetical protein